ncbi:hypothetical protein B0H14DRAFT_3564207 [Mycena olivaceomarginata]|nr:hypothetical protein B0H14DRAFT_3564207 [Mycena olivaceomarginata]
MNLSIFSLAQREYVSIPDVQPSGVRVRPPNMYLVNPAHIPVLPHSCTLATSRSHGNLAFKLSHPHTDTPLTLTSVSTTAPWGSSGPLSRRPSRELFALRALLRRPPISSRLARPPPLTCEDGVTGRRRVLERCPAVSTPFPAHTGAAPSPPAPIAARDPAGALPIASSATPKRRRPAACVHERPALPVRADPSPAHCDPEAPRDVGGPHTRCRAPHPRLSRTRVLAMALAPVLNSTRLRCRSRPARRSDSMRRTKPPDPWSLLMTPGLNALHCRPAPPEPLTRRTAQETMGFLATVPFRRGGDLTLVADDDVATASDSSSLFSRAAPTAADLSINATLASTSHQRPTDSASPSFTRPVETTPATGRLRPQLGPFRLGSGFVSGARAHASRHGSSTLVPHSPPFIPRLPTPLLTRHDVTQCYRLQRESSPGGHLVPSTARVFQLATAAPAARAPVPAKLWTLRSFQRSSSLAQRNGGLVFRPPYPSRPRDGIARRDTPLPRLPRRQLSSHGLPFSPRPGRRLVRTAPEPRDLARARSPPFLLATTSYDLDAVPSLARPRREQSPGGIPCPRRRRFYCSSSVTLARTGTHGTRHAVRLVADHATAQKDGQATTRLVHRSALPSRKHVHSSTATFLEGRPRPAILDSAKLALRRRPPRGRLPCLQARAHRSTMHGQQVPIATERGALAESAPFRATRRRCNWDASVRPPLLVHAAEQVRITGTRAVTLSLHGEMSHTHGSAFHSPCVEDSSTLLDSAIQAKRLLAPALTTRSSRATTRARRILVPRWATFGLTSQVHRSHLHPLSERHARQRALSTTRSPTCTFHPLRIYLDSGGYPFDPRWGHLRSLRRCPSLRPVLVPVHARRYLPSTCVAEPARLAEQAPIGLPVYSSKGARISSSRPRAASIRRRANTRAAVRFQAAYATACAGLRRPPRHRALVRPPSILTFGRTRIDASLTLITPWSFGPALLATSARHDSRIRYGFVPAMLACLPRLGPRLFCNLAAQAPRHAPEPRTVRVVRRPQTLGAATVSRSSRTTTWQPPLVSALHPCALRTPRIRYGLYRRCWCARSTAALLKPLRSVSPVPQLRRAIFRDTRLHVTCVTHALVKAGMRAGLSADLGLHPLGQPGAHELDGFEGCPNAPSRCTRTPHCRCQTRGCRSIRALLHPTRPALDSTPCATRLLALGGTVPASRATTSVGSMPSSSDSCTSESSVFRGRGASSVLTVVPNSSHGSYTISSKTPSYSQRLSTGIHLTAFQLQGYTKSGREATTLVDGGDPPSDPGSVLAELSSKVSSSEKLTRSKPGR